MVKLYIRGEKYREAFIVSLVKSKNRTFKRINYNTDIVNEIVL